MKGIIQSPAEPVGKKKDSPGIFDGKVPGPIGKYPRTKGGGPAEKHFDTIKGM